MPVVGKLDPFDPSTSERAEYREQAELYFIANDIPSDKQTSVFLTCCGPETYSLLRGLLAPSRPAQVGLTEIFTTLGKHYAPRVSEVVASFKFFSRHRKEGETEPVTKSIGKIWAECWIALKTAGLRLKLSKCEFIKPEVQYLGHIISAAGPRPNPAKTEAVLEAPRNPSSQGTSELPRVG
ncbi:hypothetical protein MRX96_000325 [Rhipicephalus microplus]